MTNRWVMTFMGAALLLAGTIVDGTTETAHSVSIILLIWGGIIFFLVWLAVKRSGGT